MIKAMVVVFLFYWRLILLWVMGVGFEKNFIVLKNEMSPGLLEDFIEGYMKK